jgi:hypothetical protein
MVRVPVARNTVDLPSPGISARVDTPNIGAGGEMVGRAMQGLGSELGQAANDQAQIGIDRARQQREAQTFHDHAAVKEAANNVLQWYTEAAYTGPNAFFRKSGREAVEAQPMITDGLDNLIKQTRASLNDPRQQEMFDIAMVPQRSQWAVGISDHAAREEKAYDADQSKALLGSVGELARAQYVNDPNAAEKQIDTGLAEISIAGAKQGWSREQIGLEQLKFTSGIYKDVGANLAYAGGDGPKLAQAMLDKHGASMTEDDRFAVATHARVAQNALDAEARRQEAEQRQLANEAKRDARDRATSAAANLDSGLPLDPKTYASAISDAQTSEDDGLLRRLQNGQLKNTTLFTHQHDLPGQLQAQVNDLSAKISRAGEKADPNDIIKRDALQQLYGHTTEQMKSNGLAWASSAMGAPPPQLNFNSAGSIGQRVDYVQQASRRAGQSLDPLQPSELAPLVQTWKQGDASTKAGMVMRLAEFGPLAAQAAQQVAQNDNGLLHLISLASHSNRGVAASRVTQAMAGYEAMKTEGQVVGKIASNAQGQSQFNEWAGPALQFMPGARDGVYTVAKALLAQDAASHGWKDENDADSKAWYRAVNSALGAYNRGEVQYGGLAGFNGAQTVLPENMSLDELEGRLSRANDAQFKAAGNGDPVTGNGTALSAGDLKKMHLIPVDDGVYRLEAGGSFVHTKSGQPFEIDVRKLNAPGAHAAAQPSFAEQLVAHGYARY